MTQKAWPPRGKKEETRVNRGLAAIVALILVGAFGLAFMFSPVRASIAGQDACLEAAEYHFAKATTNDTASDYHFRAGIAYNALAGMKHDCSGWEET